MRNRMKPPTSVEPPDSSLAPSQIALGGALFAELSGQRSAINRRVETITFEGDTARRTLSLDIDVPISDRQVPVPIAVFAKGEGVAAVASDEDERPLPLLTSDEAGAVAYVALRLAAAEAGIENMTPSEDRMLLDLATAPTRIAVERYQELAKQRPTWTENQRLAQIASLLAENSILFALVVSSGGRRVIRAVWDEAVVGDSVTRTLGTALLGRSGTLWLRMRGVPARAGNHFEVTAPNGTEITDLGLLGSDSATPCTRARDDQSHVYLADDKTPTTLGVLVVGLRASRLSRRTAMLAAFTTLVVLLLAIAVPGLRTSTGLFLALLGVPTALLVSAFAWVRARDHGFGEVFAVAPLFGSLLPLLAAGAVAVAGVTESVLGVIAIAASGSGLLAALNEDLLKRGPSRSEPGPADD
jgi:hypothetical protein